MSRGNPAKANEHMSVNDQTDSSIDEMDSGMDNEPRSQSTHDQRFSSGTGVSRSSRVTPPNVRCLKDYATNKLTRQRAVGNQNVPESSDGTDEETERAPAVEKVANVRRSLRITSPSVRYSKDYVTNQRTPRRRETKAESSTENNTGSEDDSRPSIESVNEDGEHEDSLEMLNNKVAATTLFEAQKDVPGTGMYGFQTPKKRGSMSALAQACSATRTPRASPSCFGTVPKTPMHLRRKNKKDLAKALKASLREDFSASESDYEPSDEEDESGPDDEEDDDDDDDDEDEDQVSDSSGDEPSAQGRMSTTGRGTVPLTPKVPVPAKLTSQPGGGADQRPARTRTTRSIANRVAANVQYFVESDNYFSAYNSTKSVTSDHTLDRLNTPRLAQDVLHRLLQETSASSVHTAAIQEMLTEHEQQFERWMFLLNEGFSVLLYGLGSKRSLLQTFHHKLLADRSVLVVNGFFPSLTVKDVLDAVANDLLDLQLQTTLHHETIDEIEQELSLQPDLHIFLLVHNLDGVAMRNVRMQSSLSRLASIPTVHLVATIDHINAPLLWDASKLGLYNFCWWDVTTMLPYSVETAFENSLLVQGGGALALSSMSSVYASLTSNARGIFMVIVKYQLANGGPANPNYAGMQFKDLYWSCREAFYVSSDIALRAQLTEFTDHKLLRIKRSLDGSEYLNIPIEHGLLKNFVDETAKKL